MACDDPSHELAAPATKDAARRDESVAGPRIRNPRARSPGESFGDAKAMRLAPEVGVE